MIVGIIGLGRMGAAIAYRAMRAGNTVYGCDLDAALCEQAQAMGVHIVSSAPEIAQQAKTVWLMVPAGSAVDAVLAQMRPYLTDQHVVIDGGNSNFADSIKRAQELATINCSFLDCGTSGGIHGKENGFCLMVGGDKKAFDSVYPLFLAVAMQGGVAYVGPSGAGHYVKMVHNGIEYGLMQAYAEGFQLLKEGSYKEQKLDLAAITRLWNHGAVIRSFLLELSHDIFKEDQKLEHISGVVQESGMGRWTVDDAHKHNIPVPVIEQSLDVRKESQKTGGNFATKVVAMLRKGFGGHEVRKL